ncbi:MAG TPA: S8 family serine peptidase, partial [Thermoanaerobaculia bacterium]|nr:S8 family serine peptidase [Thermoanaerobaculia bacterium]
MPEENPANVALPAIDPVEPPRQFGAPQLGLALTEVDRLIRANEARNVFSVDGSGLTVAVCDTGLNVDHVDFAGRVVARRNFTTDDGGDPDVVTDRHGHGSNVAGIVCADGDHRGVAPGAGVVPLKVLRDDGGGTFDSVADALQWVLDHHQEHGITAVCMSLSAGDNGTDDGPFAQHPVADRIGRLRARRVPVVVAAGNHYFTHDSRQGMAFPAILRQCVSVGAVYDEFEGPFTYRSGAHTDASGPDRITPFSQRLHESVDAACRTDVFAPGAPVTSSGIDGPHGESVQQGTSQAAPVTAGVLLLLQELHRRLTGELPEVDDLVALLRQSAVTIHDGDDERDNVEHTDLDFPRLDAF